jgi:prolyl oligopeptidase
MRVEQRFATSEGRHARALLRGLAQGRQGRRPQPHAAVRLRRLRGLDAALVLGGVGPQLAGQGGVFVLANIRGGGEFGPAWHQAAVKRHKQKSYDDFAAVAEDLIASGVTSPAHWASRAAATAACWWAR